MFSTYLADIDISKEDPISLEDIDNVSNYRKILLRRQSVYQNPSDEHKNGVYISIADVYDIDSIPDDLKMVPTNKRVLTDSEKRMILWKRQNVKIIEQVLQERKTKDFFIGFKYALGRIQQKYEPMSFMDMMIIKDKDIYMQYVLNNLTPEDLPAFYYYDRKEAEEDLKDKLMGTWLMRPTSQTSLEVLKVDGKLQESGKMYAITSVDLNKFTNYLIYYARSLGYVEVTSIKGLFELKFHPTIFDLLYSLGLDPLRYN